MTSLEFIKKEIKKSKEFLDKAIRYNLPTCIKNEKEKLQTLQQIKFELEAWEVVKSSISKEHLEDSQIRTMFGENPFMNITEEEKLIVKKALEVEDES